jgi:hypothetical protein
VIDTPDIINLKGVYEDPKEQQKEIRTWRTMTKPGPDVILLVVKCEQ